ncbi:hypothetical protein [Thiospirillum jenense]|uniref:Uncharacterized protein n=1 Tax=Thiospirillum jenense TaxID=1653858 RepID=A0A839HG96_9GAMM|nr:hypothetical protein [Thiospirillum jenense]MBB1127374.1 hypothetical protein [Thiospirillum jenense]
MTDALNSPTLGELLTTTTVPPKIETPDSPVQASLPNETLPVYSFKTDQINLLTVSMSPSTQMTQLDTMNNDTIIIQPDSKQSAYPIIYWFQQRPWFHWLILITVGLLFSIAIAWIAVVQPTGMNTLLMALRNALLFQ